jgi:Cd(II)/Pb(II)-responsive transcriptional regulator
VRIGELAKHTGTDVETIRYYEKAGLLDAPVRNAAGYRAYQTRHLEQLQFIRHCRSLQMPLADIRILLNLKANPAMACQGVNDLIDHHIDVIQQQMAALQTLEIQLKALRSQCGGPHSVQECAILRNLSEAPALHECACHHQTE